MPREIVALFSCLLLVVADAAAQEHFPSDAEVRALARRGVPVSGTAGLVIGLLGPDGSRRVVPVGDVTYDGRTIFEIGSITKVFTGIPPATSLGRAIRDSHVPRTTMGQTVKSFIGFDPDRRVGVVVLANRSNSVDQIGRHVLDTREPVSVAGISTGFHVLPLTLAVLLVAGTFAAWRRTGASRRRAVLAAVAMMAGLVIWMGGTYLLAAFGLLRFDTRPPTFMLMIVALVLLSVGLGVSTVGRRLATGLPLWMLVGSQAFRLPLELLMHEAYEAGLMPVQMSFSGFNYDIITGASAIVVAVLVAAGRAGVRTVRAWNILGTVLLCNIVIIAILSTPTSLRAFHNPPANTWVATAPYVWLPAVMVSCAILGHVVVYRRLRDTPRPGS